MATIREMANNYAELLPQKRIAKKFCKIDYAAGAKAVLEEIEKAMDLGEPPYLISAEQAYYRIKRLINELKS